MYAIVMACTELCACGESKAPQTFLILLVALKKTTDAKSVIQQMLSLCMACQLAQTFRNSPVHRKVLA